MNVETGLDNQLAHLVNSLVRSLISIEDFSIKQLLPNYILNKAPKAPLTSWDTNVIRSHPEI